ELLPRRPRPARRDGLVPGPRLQPPGGRPRLLHRRHRHDPRGQHQPRRRGRHHQWLHADHVLPEQPGHPRPDGGLSAPRPELTLTVTARRARTIGRPGAGPGRGPIGYGAGMLTARRLRRLAVTALATASLVLGTIGVAAASAALKPNQLTFQRVVGGLSAPLGVVNAGDGTGRLFVVQRGGTVRVVAGRTLLPGTFLDVSAKVLSGDERGLLGVAFHPDFATNRRLFIY